ncbi:MAG TPA: siderophore-interacting protein [Mycobacteriales bacterium]
MTSAPPVRRRPAPLRAAVRRTTRLSPHLVRVTVTGEDLTRFRWAGPAGHLKLMLPEPGHTDVALPEPDDEGLVALDRSAPITMRTYTARRFDEERRELDLDVVLHGHGPASAWAEQARLGDKLAVSVPRAAGFVQDPGANWLLLGGDASALPAIATILPTVTVPLAAYVEIDDPADRIPLDRPVAWLPRRGAPGEALAAAMLAHARPAGRGQVWVATEAGAVRHIRQGLLRALDRDQVTTRGYWRTGQANHPDHDYGDDA